MPASAQLRRALLGAVLMTPVIAAGQSGDGPPRPSTDWTTVGGDWTNARHSRLTQINTQTVKQLGAAWVSRRFEDGAGSRSTPVVVNGRVFMTAGARVYALDARTGEFVWTWRAELPPTRTASVDSTGGLIQALNAGIGFPNPSGVAVGDGLVFVGLMDG